MDESSPHTDIDKGFVAILDVLGFGKLSEQDQSAVASVLEHTIDRLLPMFDSMRSDTVTGRLKSTKFRMFSDTIVIAFPREPNGAVNQDMFHFINDYLGSLFCLLLDQNILLRGAVGYGTIVEGKYGIYGKAVVDAKYEYEATSWAGIHYTTAATSFIAKWHSWAANNDVKDSRSLIGTTHNANQMQFFVSDVTFKTELKNDANARPMHIAQRFAVPWPKDLRFVKNVSEILLHQPKTAHMRALAILSVDLDSLEDRVREIRLNTIGFLERYLARFPDANLPLEWEGPLPPLE